MSNKETIRNLFCVLNGCLPYEYDVNLLNGKSENASILIVKENSTHIMQIATSGHDDTLTVLTYDDGDDPDTDSETYQWDTDSPDFTINDILTDIENHL